FVLVDSFDGVGAKSHADASGAGCGAGAPEAVEFPRRRRTAAPGRQGEGKPGDEQARARHGISATLVWLMTSERRFVLANVGSRPHVPPTAGQHAQSRRPSLARTRPNSLRLA